MNDVTEEQAELLLRIARQAMFDYGLEPDFPAGAAAEIEAQAAARPYADGAIDLRDRLWCSIDNDDSRDLDQLTVADRDGDGIVRVRIAIADVSACVKPGSLINAHAKHNTTSVYTPAIIYSMLPERLSTDLTSLNPDEDRRAVVTELTIDETGDVLAERVYPALVRNHAKLTYDAVDAWLQNEGELPEAAAALPGLDDNLRLQDAAAQNLRRRRHAQGALELETIEVRARVVGGVVSELHAERRNRAKDLIEDLMIAANGAVARFLTAADFPVLRRVVQAPERWQRIVDLAFTYGYVLPEEPDATALNEFLDERHTADPERFPDVSLAVIKLLGRGKYAVSLPGRPIEGHFGLAVDEYAHSTAPNRRYPDLLTQRLIKAALAGERPPYSTPALEELAEHCTSQENAAKKVERRVRKSAAALFLAGHLGDELDGLVTGASDKGTWVRTLEPPAEGRLVEGAEGLDVGDAVRVRLLEADAERGFIDFALVAVRAEET